MFALVWLDADAWWPAMDFPVVLATTFALTVACAAISYYALERPLMAWGRRTFSNREPERSAPGRPVPERLPAEPVG